MTELRLPRLMYLKAFLFICIGTTASTIVLIEHPSVRLAALLFLAIWSFARAYYFAFYVIQNYIDPGYRFAGLIDFGRYLLKRPGG